MARLDWIKPDKSSCFRALASNSLTRVRKELSPMNGVILNAHNGVSHPFL